MTLRRFQIHPASIENGACCLEGQNAAHLIHVLRLGPKSRVELFDGKGSAWEAEVAAVSKDRADLVIIRPIPKPPPAATRLALYQSYLKDRKMDQVIRQATELGAWKVCAFFSQRAVPRPNAAKTAKRKERWEKIAAETLKQCRGGRMPQLDVLPDLNEVLQETAQWPVKVMFWEKADTPVSALPWLPEIGGHVAVAVGPEGGFSDQEAKTARDRGFVLVSMGRNILRADTAAVAALTLVQYFYGALEPPISA